MHGWATRQRSPTIRREQNFCQLITFSYNLLNTPKPYTNTHTHTHTYTIIMRSVIPFYVLAASALANAFVLPEGENLKAFTNDIAFVAEKNRLIQLSPSETRWVSEEQKLELKRVCGLDDGISYHARAADR